MLHWLDVTSQTSISSEVAPFVLSGLSNVGFALIRIANSTPNLELDMIALAAALGPRLSDNMGYHILFGEQDDEILAPHTEGIYHRDGIIPYFALGCLTPSSRGGETRVFDGRKAARLVQAENPDLAGITIRYGSLANTDQSAVYPLVNKHPEFGPVLRYRARVVSNSFVTPHVDEQATYHIVDDILERSVAVIHRWNAGDMLLVNNTFTLHDRMPYVGLRRLIRVRYGDSINQRITF